MCRAIGLFVHVNCVVSGQRYAERAFYRFSGSGEKTRAKVGIFSRFLQEEFFGTNMFLH